MLLPAISYYGGGGEIIIKRRVRNRHGRAAIRTPAGVRKFLSMILSYAFHTWPSKIPGRRAVFLYTTNVHIASSPYTGNTKTGHPVQLVHRTIPRIPVSYAYDEETDVLVPINSRYAIRIMCTLYIIRERAACVRHGSRRHGRGGGWGGPDDNTAAAAALFARRITMRRRTYAAY